MLQKIMVSVPDMAVEVFFHWEITPPQGRVLLYRTPTDPSPQSLVRPSGKGRAELVELRTLYYEFLPGLETFKFYTDGFRDLRQGTADSW